MQQPDDNDPVAVADVDMGFWGNYDVIRNIKLKNKLLNAKDPLHAQYKTGVIFCGGGHKGIYLSGFALALDELMLSKAFDYCLGISTGALGGYYFAGRKVSLGTTLIEDSLKHKLISPKRYRVMNSKLVEDFLRYKKPVERYKLQKSRTKLLIGLTDKDGDGYFVDALAVADPVPYILASLSHPLVTAGRPAIVDHKKIVDGCIGNPLPISYAIELGLTDILVVMTQELDQGANWYWGSSTLEKLMKRVFYFRLSSKLKSKLHTYSKRYEEEQRYFKGELHPPAGVRIAAIYPKKSVGTFTTNRKLLRRAHKAAREFTRELFLGA